MPLKDLALIVLVCVGWALNIVIGKVAVSELTAPPIMFVFLRTLLVAVLLAPWLRRVPPSPIRVCVATMLLSGGAYGLLAIGLQSADASSAAIVTLSGMPLTVLLAMLVLGERIGLRRCLGMIVTLVGVATVIVGPSGVKASVGLIFVAASAAAGAVGSILLKKISGVPALTLQAWAGLSGTVLLLPLTLMIETDQVAHTLSGGWPLLVCIVGSGLVGSVMSHTLYYSLLQRHDANLMASLILMTPLLAIMLGIATLGERPSAGLFFGAGLALVGVGVILAPASRRI